jgi:hypothetical protein
MNRNDFNIAVADMDTALRLECRLESQDRASMRPVVAPPAARAHSPISCRMLA